MTALRRRMIEEMALAGLSAGTQVQYAAGVSHLAKTYHRAPDRITEEEVRGYMLRLRETGAARGTFLARWYGLRFFYVHTLGVEWGLFLKKKWGRPARSGCRWRGATRSAGGCSGVFRSAGIGCVSR